MNGYKPAQGHHLINDINGMIKDACIKGLKNTKLSALSVQGIIDAITELVNDLNLSVWGSGIKEKFDKGKMQFVKDKEEKTQEKIEPNRDSYKYDVAVDRPAVDANSKNFGNFNREFLKKMNEYIREIMYTENVGKTMEDIHRKIRKVICGKYIEIDVYSDKKDKNGNATLTGKEKVSLFDICFDTTIIPLMSDPQQKEAKKAIKETEAKFPDKAWALINAYLVQIYQAANPK